MAMRRATPFFAPLIVLSVPQSLFACGGCTDKALLMTAPWAGFGILLLWAWIIAGCILRRRVLKHEGTTAVLPVKGTTLAVFAALGSAVYIGLVFLTRGSFLLPSLLLGFLWVVYLIARLTVDILRFVTTRASNLRRSIATSGVFLALVVATVAYWQHRLNTVEYCISCLRYGYLPECRMSIIPKILSYGQEAVPPLVEACDEALKDTEKYGCAYVVKNATFCLGCIGGKEAERFLGELIEKPPCLTDSQSPEWFYAACFAYARCAEARAMGHLTALFDGVPRNERRDDRCVVLGAMAFTGSREGIIFVFDHMDILLGPVRIGGYSPEWAVARPVSESLVFGSDPNALRHLSVYSYRGVCGYGWYAEPPSGTTDELEWRGPDTRIELEWRKNERVIRDRWNALVK